MQSGGYYRPGNPCDNVAAGAHAYRELGFTGFKLRFGRPPLQDDLVVRKERWSH
jgi:L-alanine-DL-glutamate epimerase-like enolase superfamily enzyme